MGSSREALRAGQSHIIALNSANEVAVNAFLQRQILFSQIPEIVEACLERHKAYKVESLETVFEVDEAARTEALSLVRKS